MIDLIIIHFHVHFTESSVNLFLLIIILVL